MSYSFTFASTFYLRVIDASSTGERERLCKPALNTVLYLFTILDQGCRKINEFKRSRLFLFETELNLIKLLLKNMKQNNFGTYAIFMCVAPIRYCKDKEEYCLDNYRFSKIIITYSC